MKKLLFLTLLIVSQAEAIIVNYICLTSPDGKKKVHLLADMHVCPDSELRSEQQRVLESFLLKNKNSIIYIDGYSKENITSYRMVGHPPLSAVIELITKYHDIVPLAIKTSAIFQQDTLMPDLCCFSEDNKIEIKEDERPDVTENLPQESVDNLFEKPIIHHVENGTKDIIVIAGFMHTAIVSKTISEEYNYTSEVLKETFDGVEKVVLDLESKLLKIVDEATQKILASKTSDEAEEAIKEAQKNAYHLFFNSSPLSADELTSVLG